MVIGGVSGPGSGMKPGVSGMNMQEDAVSKELKRQIERAQKELQNVSSNQDLTMEEKMKKRQEIQQEIASLNQQLRQHQIEQRKEQQAARQENKGNAMDEVLGGSRSEGSGKAGNPAGLSKAGMRGLISADASMKQAQVQGSVAAKMDGRADVLEMEIQQDAGKGENSLKAKEEELAEVQQKSREAAGAQASTLAEAGQKIQEAGKAETDGAKSAEEDSKAEAGRQASEEDRDGLESIYTKVDVRL